MERYNGQFMPMDLYGKKFNFLTAISISHKTENGYFWNCVCDCGKDTKVLASRLVRGKIKSCGHLKGNKGVAKTHGMRYTKIYSTWKNMKIRCNKETSQNYYLYGGRGISVCERWMTSFENFYSDMKEGYNDKLQLDRKDVNGNYCKENCKWSTRKEQANNKRNTAYIIYNGIKRSSGEWAEIIGAKTATLTKRVRLGYSPEECLYGKKCYTQKI